MSERGYIYFLLNQAMPGLVKIGFTTRTLDQRMSELNTSGMPKPFELGAAFSISNPEVCESEIHKTLSNKRVNRGREFFKIDLRDALEISFPVIKKHLIQWYESQFLLPGKEAPPSFDVDEDDVYFMQFILHDSYAEKRPLSTEELLEYHSNYHQLELEYKLIKLSEKGLIERVKYRNVIQSLWKMTPNGIKFMFDKGHVLQDLIDDTKRKKGSDF